MPARSNQHTTFERAAPSRQAAPVRKALLLRVGMDRGTGGALGPIFPDGTFEYIPIPETTPTCCALTYATLPGRHVCSLATVLPARLAARRPHIDPDFSSTTYGDAAPRKRQQLLRLEPGDLLVFYAGLAPCPPEDRPKLFAVGCFEVERVHALSSRDLARPDLRRRFGRTAHFLRRPPDQHLALVEGDPAASRFFPRAVSLGDGRDCILRDLAGFGYQGSLLRAVGHWVRTATGVSALEAWLTQGAAALVKADTRLIPIASSLRPLNMGCDLVVDDPRPKEGDWIIGLTEPDRQGIQALARVNSVTCVSGRRRAFCSIYWCFADGGPLLGSAVLEALTRDRMILDTSTVRRLISRLDRRYRVGWHTKAPRTGRLR